MYPHKNKDERKYDRIYKSEAPEGGWGWMAAIGVALTFTATIGPFQTFGLLYKEKLESFGEGTQAITLLASVNTSVCCLIGFITNFALTKYSCRQVSMAGSALFFIGSFWCAFCTSTTELIFAFGILQGVGTGLMFPAAFTSINHYFVRKRTFVMGVTQLIIGVGCMLLPPIVQKIFHEYGFVGTQVIISAISLHTVLSGVMQQPVEQHLKRVELTGEHLEELTKTEPGYSPVVTEQSVSVHNRDTENDIRAHLDKVVYSRNLSTERTFTQRPRDNFETTKLISEGDDATQNESLKQTDRFIIVSYSDFHRMDSVESKTTVENFAVSCKFNDGNSTVQNKTMSAVSDIGNPVSISDSRASVKSLGSWTSSLERNKPGQRGTAQRILQMCWSAVVDFMDLRLLLDLVYLNIAIGVAFSFFADITNSTLIPLILLDHGYSNADTALFISVYAAGDIAGRVCIALIGAAVPRMPSRTLFLGGVISSIIVRTAFVCVHEYIALATFVGLMGFFRSFIQVPLSLVIAEYSLDRFPAAYGLCMVMSGIICLVAGPLIGWVRDFSDSYPYCLYTLNILHLTTCALPWTLEIIFNKNSHFFLKKQHELCK